MRPAGRLIRGFTLDAGALIALERGQARARRLVRDAGRVGRDVTVPAPVLAQAWRGSSQRALVEALKGAIVEPLDEELARSAGELLGRTGTSDVIDATVAVSAARRADIVITSDPDHLQRLADDLSTIRVLRV